MTRLINLSLVLIFIFNLNLVYSDGDDKSSLTFVIDDTGSMGDDIAQVKSGVNDIFDTVMHSNASQIQDFVLVTFNDPGTQLRTVTTQRDEFDNALRLIDVDGGDDCPEMAMAGLESALAASRAGSYLFVFTDASAKDHEKYKKVTELAQKKACQVVFVLTGTCSGGESAADFRVYYKIAVDTSGQVFHLDRKSEEVKQVLNYVKDTIKSRKTVIATKSFPPGTHKFDYTVDGRMKELTISVSGRNPTVGVVDPAGSKAATEDIMRTSRVAVVKVAALKPGVYTAEVGSDTGTSVLVAGTTTVHFRHGFAPFKPTSVKDTATRPIPGVNSYLSIKLSTEGGKVRLHTVQILDMDDHVVLEKPLTVSDEKEQFYITEPFTPPDVTFRIAIKGYDEESKTIITRISLTPIEVQVKDPATVAVTIPPTATIIGESKVNAEYDAPLQIKCKVSANPIPAIVWENDDGDTFEAPVSLIELPNDYISVLDIDKVNKNNTYKCKASNGYGSDSKEIYVQTIRKKFFDVLEIPKDATIEYEKEGRFLCRVSASPQASITWYRNGREVHSGEENIDVSPDGSSLVIKSMQPALQGKYMCEARNHYNRKVIRFRVSISGVEPPRIDKSTSEIHVTKGSDAEITCRVTHGKPKPIMRWFFKHILSEENVEIDGGETIKIEDVTPDDAGTYSCEAYNTVDIDFHRTDLIVEYPPTIKKGLQLVRKAEGKLVRLRCVVDGSPAPEVRWFANGAALSSDRHYNIRDTHSLSFKATVDDSGNYTCEAVNKLGAASKSVQVIINVPPSIEIPEETTLEVNVGAHLALHCRADGVPKPQITWDFNSFDPKVSTKTIKIRDPTGTLRLPRVQVNTQGFYTCVARNDGGQTNITYEIRVNSPPQIINVYPEKTFTAVVGDLALRIPCKTIGNPKPEITWMDVGKGYNVASGSEWYDIEKDGTLVIKNVDKSSAGSYLCQAKNRLGIDDETYEVFVEEFPKPGPPTRTIFIEEGKSSRIPCDVRHRRTSLLRWYKDSKNIFSGELTLMNATRLDEGLYTCRVSEFLKSNTGNTMVKIGFKPKFHHDEDKHIEFEEGLAAIMDCTAEGEPAPEVSWWHDGHKIEETSMTYTFNMKFENRGQYFCLVKNNIGHIVRSFEISSKECLLNIKKDLNGNQPLIMTPDLKWPSFDIIDGYMRIPVGERVLLTCPKGFKNLHKTETLASCKQETSFEFDGGSHKYSELICKEELTPVTKNTGSTCLPGNTETIRVGYDIRGEFLEVYEVCLDKDRRVPLYAKHNIHRSVAGVEINKEDWYNSELLPLNFDTLYACNLQLETISSILGKWFHRDDNCCFSKRQLVNQRDVVPGLAQAATFSHLNVIPHWSTCNAENWESVERRVRQLAKSTDHHLIVWTGTSEQLQLKGWSSEMTEINIIDRDSREQPVSQYLWKVVQDPETKAAIAIVQVNVPDVKLSEVRGYARCRDICGEVAWMKSKSWRDVSKGYTYCCGVHDFEKAFGLDGLFDGSSGKVLYDVSLVPDHSLT